MALIFDNVNNRIIDDSTGKVIAPLDGSTVVQNAGGAPSIKEGLFGSIPAAGNVGALYVASDTAQLLRDNGTSWDVIGATGAGSVTSVGLTAPPQFAVSGSPITTFGTLNLSWNTQSANKIFAGPSSGTDALPTFRNLTVADLPAFTVPFANITSTPTTLGGYGITNAYSRIEIDAMTFNWSRITGTPTTLAGYGITDAKNGTVTSVQASGGTTGLSFTGGPITDSGTLTLGGTLAITNGGTGATTANGALNALLPVQTGSSGYVLTTDGANTTWAASTGGSGSGGPAAVRLATTGALPTYTASGAGVGKTLTGTAATALTIDGVTPAVNDRVLIKDETSTASTNNGVYVVSQQGTGASGTGEVFTIAIPATVTGGATTLAGKDIWFSSPTVDYYVWFRDISGAGSGSDPVISGRTRLGSVGCTYSSGGYSQVNFGTALRDFINANGTGVFTATYAGGLVTVTAAVSGPAKTAAQNDPVHNPGFTYNVTTPGANSHPYVLTRASDFITPKSGALIPVVLGGSNADTIWMLTTDGTIVLDTTQLTFTRANQTSGSYVNTFNTRSGAVTLTSSDVTTALTFTPYNATNPSGYITSAGTATNVSGIVALANGGTGLSGAGSANRVLGVINAGGALEYKTIAAGTATSVVHTANTITINNTGVTSAVAGTGIGVSAATGAVTISNTGVTSIVAGTNITISGSTGAVTINSTAVLPSQPGNTGKFLTTDGTSASWGTTPGVRPVRLASNTNHSLVAAGSGATKTLSSSVYGQTTTVDSVQIATGDRVLLKNQTTGADNGVYTVTADGTAALTAQVLTITITSASGLAGTCIYWSDPYDDHYFWFQNDGVGTNPSPAGRVGPAACNIVSASGTTQAAVDFAAFVNSTSNGFWTATQSSNVVTLTATTASRGPAHIGASNGIPSTGWTITTTAPGSGSKTVLTRASDYNTNPVAGDLISVVAGTINQKTTWLLTTQNAVLDTTALVYAQPATSGGTGTVTSVNASGGTTGLSFSGGPVTTSGTLTLAGTLNVANGGTGAATLTGYVKGSGTSAMTASATIPTSDLTGTIATSILTGNIDGGVF